MAIDRSKDGPVLSALFVGLIALMAVGLNAIFERMGG